MQNLHDTIVDHTTFARHGKDEWFLIFTDGSPS
jgi:hypothetical protein